MTDRKSGLRERLTRRDSLLGTFIKTPSVQALEAIGDVGRG